ncbi:putative telomere silencing protein Zds1 [Emericellopsis atlantica]|uniref:Telomere silencing protein Zds1 n=1 Tax=Emericellopsis atlantica TaxID=2614577 RepID=A0A9P8CRX9_9HYPO|nr:putative telomere silencing protein Zds1 [Emericellopsis atlantica]KAG9256812.1 putative telomere silencing protein Zds1 [Emericellopsis atlantica]
MAAPRPHVQDGGSFASRRGHTSQLSISDPSHHVTEAIGTMYGDEYDSMSDHGRPLSFIGGSGHHEQIQTMPQNTDFLSVDARRPLHRSTTDHPMSSSPQQHSEHGSLRKAQTLPIQTSVQPKSCNDGSPVSPRSPTISLRDVQADPATSQFQLTNIDNPNDIAQELSNLQALRRMSMDVGNMKDPDMPPMALSKMPAIAPSGDDDEADPSRLLWVPARVHPELAPSEFQSFLETRVKSIRRTSRDGLSPPDGDVNRSNSTLSLTPGGGSLRRQKSMLSRQVDNSPDSSYVDGADRLERQRSKGPHSRELSIEDLVKDPNKTVQQLAQETQQIPEGTDVNSEDMPILPMAPGTGLRRSTRTTYRKGGSLRAGDRASRRTLHRPQDGEAAEAIPPVPEAPPGHTLTRVQSEPVSDSFSRPGRAGRRPQGFIQDSPVSLAALEGSSQAAPAQDTPAIVVPRDYQEQLPVRTAENAQPKDQQPSEKKDGASYQEQPHSKEPSIAEPPPKSARRKASKPAINQPASPQSSNPKNAQQPTPPVPQNLNDQLGSSSTMHHAGGSSRTDNLTMIPTIEDERKPEKKSKKDRDDDSSSTKSTSSAWKWFKSSGDDKKKDESKRAKAKALVEKAQDNVRLDVIQNSIEKNGPKSSRESFVLDRDAVDSKLQEERKKESNRRSDSKKDKDGSIFSSIFGTKKRDDKDRHSKKSQHLRVPSEQPVVKQMEPDVDYHWTRFPLLEERAIYRMAHIKLANPRRPLLSQVLLSNFMYSYLAIVQAMHPNMNVPMSPQQKRQEEEARRKREEEEYLAQQQMMQENGEEPLDHYDFDYHRGHAQYADANDGNGHVHGSVEYVDESQIYEDDHGNGAHHQQQHHQDYGYEQDSYDHYQYRDNGDQRHDDGRHNMW